MIRIIEYRYTPQILAFLITVSFWASRHYLPTQKEIIIRMANISVNVNVNIIGFLLTVLAVIHTLKSTRIEAMSNKLKRKLLTYLKNSIGWNVGTLVLSFLVLIIDNTKEKEVLSIFLNSYLFAYILGYFYIFLIFTNIFHTTRFASLFTLLLDGQQD
jgi:hypothetical protein